MNLSSLTSSVKSVQRGSTSFVSANGGVNITIPVAVVMAKAVLVIDGRTTGGTYHGSGVTGVINSTTNILATTLDATTGTTYVDWQILEFN